jgi:hypothetical protein
MLSFSCICYCHATVAEEIGSTRPKAGISILALCLCLLLAERGEWFTRISMGTELWQIDSYNVCTCWISIEHLQKPTIFVHAQ